MTLANKKKVIIVDDDRDLLKLLKMTFQEEGFEVHVIEHGKEALRYLLQPKNLKSSCLIVLDRLLGDMDGLEILKQLSEVSHPPVLILSILSAEKDMVEGLHKGAIDYIAKPFSLSILMEKAHSLIAQVSQKKS